MKPKLDKNITREEFEALANRKPNLDGDWLYRYEYYTIVEDEMLYPKFSLYDDKRLLFRTFEEAEHYLKQNKLEDENIRFYCHYITQISVGDDESEVGACWMYDGDKNLIDYSITQWTAKEPENYHYFGKPKNLLRFTPGEIVEVRTGREVRLALLVHPSTDVEWCWQYLHRCNADNKTGSLHYWLDGSDDACYILDGPNEYYHDHVSPLRIMKTHFPVPDDIRKTMEGWMESFNRGVVEDDTVGYYEDMLDIDRYGSLVGEFYRLNIKIKYDRHSETPHLQITDNYGLNVGLRIDRPEYYGHDKYIGRLSLNQIKSLANFLGKTDACRSNWWYMLRDWNENEADDGYQIPLDMPIPDYRKLICNK